MTAEMPSINDLADTPIERDYSLILTVYQKSKVEDFSRSLSSMLNQTIPPKEIIVVEDGPISIELAEYVERQANTTNISVLKLKNNVGPALAAQAGIDIAKCALIARLDTDDEALPNRMERELQFLSENPEYDSVGSLVQEISLDGNISSAVNLPESFEEIREYSRKRCPCRQTTLLYRKTALQSVGGYNNLRVAEEWDLYNRLIEAGCKCHNIQAVLVKMYVDDNYYARRGGITTLFRLAQFKTDMLKAGRMSFSDYIPSMAASIISCLLPNRIRTFVYVKLLRD